MFELLFGKKKPKRSGQEDTSDLDLIIDSDFSSSSGSDAGGNCDSGGGSDGGGCDGGGGGE